ncbi:hypothetical protein CRUP_000944, partial [Coryphaenoides rupestris]
MDINDNVPTFTNPSYEVNLKESDTQGTYVIVVYATDGDDKTTNNGTFDMRIVSVTPKPSGVEFFMNQYENYGNISFKGCLDYEKAKKYTVLVEVKDRGEKVKLSSTCTVIIHIKDQNNHIPTFTGETGEIMRLQVADRDTKGTDAWRVKYEIHGKLAAHFRIDTTPATNEGVMYVIKPLSYEDQPSLNLTITVKNDGKYFSCKVLSKNGKGGLWDVAQTLGHGAPSTRVVTVNIEDVNDPPIFNPKTKTVRVYEDIPVGQRLEVLTAIDRDVNHGNQITYRKGHDPGGVPPETGTGTLSIQLKDRNDNVPQLATGVYDVCISDDDDRPSQANLTATDLDLPPFAGPFRFALHGDVKDRWRIHPQH